MSAPRAFPFACVVLAAGAGTRYGGPKAAAEVESGVRFVDRVAMLAKDAGSDPVVVVLAPGIVPPAAAGRIVAGDPAAEQIASLRRGLAQLAGTPARATLVWPVDHPYVRLESALAVVDAFRRTGAPIVIPTHEGRRGHPTMFARETWNDLMTAEREGARGVIHAYGARVLDVAVEDAGVLRDVNHPND